MPQPILRRRYLVTGEVQGVGFRYRARYAAGLLGLTGWVENLWDGSVQLEAQGTAEQLDGLLPAILRGSHWIRIESCRVTELPPKEREYGFTVYGQ